MIPSALLEPALTRLAQASLYGGLLVLIVLALRAVVGRWLSPRWVFALWLIAMARLALPVAPVAPFSIFTAAPAALAPVLHAPTIIAPAQGASPHPGASRGEAPASAGPAPMPRPLFIGGLAWLAGASVLSLAIAAGQVRLSRMARGARQICEPNLVELLEHCKDRLGVRSPLTIAECPGVTSPLLLGTVRPMLLLPPGLAANLGTPELRSIFMHELAHVRRGDIAIGWAATVILIVHWFNPLVWLAVNRMKADREVACDALALSALEKQERPAYGHTLITLLEHASRSRHIPGLAAIAEDNGDIRRRITMVTRFRPVPRSAAILPAALVAVLACVSLTDAQPPRGISAAVPAGPAPAGLTGEQVFRSIADLYASAESYEDEGVATTRFVDSSTPMTRSRPFSLVFSRPSKLRYEFTDGDNKTIVWTEGDAIKSWWTLQPQVKEFDTMEMALAGPSGTSGGSATATTTLLMPDLNWGVRMTELADPRLLSVERIDDTPCLKVEGTVIDGSTMTVWADAKSYAVRRTLMRQRVDPANLPGAIPGPAFTCETTITFKPRFNAKIGPERFEPGLAK